MMIVGSSEYRRNEEAVAVLTSQTNYMIFEKGAA